MIQVSDVIDYLKSTDILCYWTGSHEFLSREIAKVSTDQDAMPGDLAWISTRQARSRLSANYVFNGTLLIGPVGFEINNLPYLACESPKLAFIYIVNRFFSNVGAIVWESPEGLLPEGTEIHPSARISPGARIGSRVRIHEGVEIGPNTVIANTEIFDTVRIGANCSIGLNGFGFELDENGRYWRFPHLGGVIIGRNVEIGSNTSIDRGSIGNTIISAGSKIDNLVHIAHNVFLGENTLVIAGSMIGGSVVIGNSVWIAPSVSVMNQVHIGSNSVLGIGAVVLKDVEDNSVMVGNPAKLLRKNSTDAQ